MNTIYPANKRILWLVSLMVVGTILLAACGAQPTEKVTTGVQSAQGATQKAPAAQSGQKATVAGYPAQSQAAQAPTMSAYAAPGQQPAAQPKAATAPTAYPAVKAGEVVKGQAFIEKAEAALNTSAAGKVTLKVSGNRPTPCHDLKYEIGQPDKDGKLVVNFYTLLQADKVCIQSLAPFETTVDVGPLAKGKYTLFANEQKAGEVTIP